MSTKTQTIELNRDCPETIELKVLQDWAIENISGEELTTEEIVLFKQYRNSAEGQQAYEDILASAPSY
jgi:hypothetical protein